MWETPTGVPGIDDLEEERAVHSFGQNRVLRQICSVENRMQATSVMKLTVVMLSHISHISVSAAVCLVEPCCRDEEGPRCTACHRIGALQVPLG